MGQESAIGFIRFSFGLGLIRMLRALTVIRNVAQTFIGMAFLKHGLGVTGCPYLPASQPAQGDCLLPQTRTRAEQKDG